MNLTLSNIIMSLKLEAYAEENHFSQEQRNELCGILDTIDVDGFPTEKELITVNPFKLAKVVKKYNKANKDAQDKCNVYEELYFKYGGSKERLDKIKDDLIKASAPVLGDSVIALRKAGFKI